MSETIPLARFLEVSKYHNATINDLFNDQLALKCGFFEGRNVTPFNTDKANRVKESNLKTMGLFLSALNKEYGPEMTSDLASRLDITQGKPLSGRLIHNIVRDAKAMKSIADFNARAIDKFIDESGGLVNLTNTKFCSEDSFRKELGNMIKGTSRQLSEEEIDEHATKLLIEACKQPVSNYTSDGLKGILKKKPVTNQENTSPEQSPDTLKPPSKASTSTDTSHGKPPATKTDTNISNKQAFENAQKAAMHTFSELVSVIDGGMKSHEPSNSFVEISSAIYGDLFLAVRMHDKYSLTQLGGGFRVVFQKYERGVLISLEQKLDASNQKPTTLEEKFIAQASFDKIMTAMEEDVRSRKGSYSSSPIHQQIETRKNTQEIKDNGIMSKADLYDNPELTSKDIRKIVADQESKKNKQWDKLPDKPARSNPQITNKKLSFKEGEGEREILELNDKRTSYETPSQSKPYKKNLKD